jgi:hypothetical protein
MSIHVMNAVWRGYPSGGSQLLTLLALADWSNDQGESWPSVESISQKTRQSRRNVQYNLRVLEEQGYVTTDNHPKYPSRLYRVNLGRLFDEPGCTQGGANFARGGRKILQEGAQTLHPIHQEPSVDTSTPPNPPRGAEEERWKFTQTERDIAEKLWNYFITKSGKNPSRVIPTGKRMSMAVRRLRDIVSKRGLSIEQAVVNLECCIDCMCGSKYHQENGYVEWEQIFTTYERVEKWTERAKREGY